MQLNYARPAPDFTPAGIFGRDRGLAPRQLDLCLWERGTVQEVLAAYFGSLVGLSEHTISDYRTREGWLLRVLGPWTRIESINVETLARLARKHGPDGDGSLMYVTIAKRFDYLRAACEYAAARKAIKRDDVPSLPKLPDDGKRLQRALTLVEFKQLCLALPDRFRRFATLGYFSGHHSLDLFTMTHGMIEPDHVWVDEKGEELWRGRIWRRNHKVPDCAAAWVPIEPELRAAALDWKRSQPLPDDPVVGKLWALKKAFDHACDHAGIERATPNRDLRRSFASMLSARGYGAEMIRHQLGHLGQPQFDEAGNYQRGGKSSITLRHYMRATDDLIVRELKRRRAET
jgi:hypothetical protein